jgi:hypothetical protein
MPVDFKKIKVGINILGLTYLKFGVIADIKL